MTEPQVFLNQQEQDFSDKQMTRSGCCCILRMTSVKGNRIESQRKKGGKRGNSMNEREMMLDFHIVQNEVMGKEIENPII